MVRGAEASPSATLRALLRFQGQRDYQEDTVAVHTTPTAFLGGVFDGHGGDEVSKELEKILLGVSPRLDYREQPAGRAGALRS